MIQSKQDLADFCLRQLGAPVIEIEIDDEQLTDNIELAVQYYHEQHFDGIDRDYVKVQVTAQDISNRYFDLPEPIFSVLRVVNTANVIQGSELLFNVQYQIMMHEMQHITSSGGVGYLYTTMNYLTHLDFILRKEKTFRFNRRMNRIYLDINWVQDVKEGDWLVFEVYKAIDPETYTDVYNDRWLKRYATALIKRQWGSNLKKYSGMTLPGGITYNGQTIYDEAVVDIEKLEQEAIDAGPPLGFMIG